MLSSFLLMIAHMFNMLLPECEEACYSVLTPLILIGIAYSIYAAVLWGCIPYIVEARTVGTAFGLCTAIQNTGMSIAPTISSSIITATKDQVYGYYWVSYFWLCCAALGSVINLLIFLQDLRTGNVLMKVHKENQIIDLITTPAPDTRRRLEHDDNFDPNTREYLLNQHARNTLKRSMANVHK